MEEKESTSDPCAPDSEEEESTEDTEEDDGISVDEYGTEWYEDEVPSDTRPLYKNWSFEKYQISDNEHGNMIMYIFGIIISIYTWICTTLFCYMYRNLSVVKIEKTFYGMGDIIFFIIAGFEFV